MSQRQNSATLPIRNIGILAHVDAGKTTLTEQLLFTSGAIRNAGSVDKGTTRSDILKVERERGISVCLSTTSFRWQGVTINLIDTPGHVDFSAEIEYSLHALDCAVLVVSAVEGIQAHTETIWKALRSLQIPTIIFVNKIDRIGADSGRILLELKKQFSPDCIALQKTCNEETDNAHPSLSWTQKEFTTAPDDPFFAPLVETACEADEALLERFFLDEMPPFHELDTAFAERVAACSLFPVYFGVAKNSVGMTPLLDAIITYFPAAQADDNAPINAVVFKTVTDPKLGKIAFVRLFSGRIDTRDVVFNQSKQIREKATQIRELDAFKYVESNSLTAGSVGVVCGFSNARVGDILGNTKQSRKTPSLGTALLTVRVEPRNEADYSALAAALTELTDEDPRLNLNWLREERELHIKVKGWIQIEVLEAILSDRFGINAKFGNPSIIYKETPAKSGYGFERYWMPKPCWAIVKFLIEPGEPGSGVFYQSRLSIDDVALKYQNEIERTIPLALKQGPKGWEVTDIKITLIEGEDHNVHSHPGDFIIATPMAVMNGLVESDTTLLEPILSYKIEAPEELLGTITSDLTQLRASFNSPSFENDKFVIEGKIPAATCLEYPIKLSSRSGGKGKIVTNFAGFEPCALADGTTTPYRGVSPLDRDKYILQARKAL